VAVVALGAVLDSIGTGAIPMVICLLLMGLWLSSLLVPKGSEKPVDHHHESIWVVLRRPEVTMVFVVCFLLQASHGPYYTFYTIYLEDHDYSRSVIGQLWALGVLAEIGVFLIMHRLLPRFGVRALLLWSLALTTLRWLLVAWFVEWAPVMIFAQILHAASFGVYHAVAIHLIHKFFVGRHQGRGQALYSSLSFGAGGAAGSLMSGYVWAGVSPSATFIVAAAVSTLAFGLAWRGIRTKNV
jgi:PPP family 3-phenylpropionic acid transporter